MTSLTVDLKIIQKSQEIIYLPEFLAKELNLLGKRWITIFFGIGHERNVRLQIIKKTKREMYITSKLQTSLYIPYAKKVMVNNEGDGIKIGPIIGILTTDYTGKKFLNTKSGKEHPFSSFFRTLLSPEPLYPVYYFVFTPENVHWDTKLVTGYYYSKRKMWSKITIPIPDVIYNRIPNRSIERVPYIERFKEQFSFTGGKIFNSNFFNKWDIYRILAGEEDTKDYIPETYLNPSLLKFNEMIQKNPIVYLKPANGSLGLGIYKIFKNNKAFVVQYRRGEYNQSLSFKQPESIYKHIFSQKKQQRYVIQQGIDLIDYKTKPVDFRVQLHKNYLNQWQLIAIGAKAAGKGSVTTHLRTGGSLLDAKDFIEHRFKLQSQHVKQKLQQASIKIAETLEVNMNEPIGELGLDIGIDKNLRIWLFEVNSKPGRSIFKHPNLKAAQFESSKRLIEYSIYLSGFMIPASNTRREDSDETI